MPRKKTKEEFIVQADLVHPHGRYDYSGVNYITATAKVRVKCNLHGYFVTTPTRILRGTGCPECGVAKRAKTIKDGGLPVLISKAEKGALSRTPLYNLVMRAFNVIDNGGSAERVD